MSLTMGFYHQSGKQPKAMVINESIWEFSGMKGELFKKDEMLGVNREIELEGLGVNIIKIHYMTHQRINKTSKAKLIVDKRSYKLFLVQMGSVQAMLMSWYPEPHPPLLCFPLAVSGYSNLSVNGTHICSSAV